MMPSGEDLTYLRTVSRMMLADPFFLDAVEQLVWRIADSENTLTVWERREYVAALVQQMRAKISESAIDRDAKLTEAELDDLTDAALVAAMDFSRARPLLSALH